MNTTTKPTEMTMNNNKQSSVEWLFCALIDQGYKNPHDMELISIIEEAKERHRQEIQDAYWLGNGDALTCDCHNLDEIFEYIFKVRNEK